MLLHRIGALLCILLVQRGNRPVGRLTPEERVVVTLAAPEGNANLKIVIVLVFGAGLLVAVDVAEPFVLQDFGDGDALARLYHKHLLDEVPCFFADGNGVLERALQDQSVQVAQTLTFERHCALQNSEQQHAERPNIDPKASIALVNKDLRR